jgi:medium-chain acyl-[acyl-carrier-protein] hydrolase
LWFDLAVHAFEFPDPAIGVVRRTDADQQLFCLPFPGGAASGFLPWADLLPARVELVAAQLGGREDRFLDPAPTSVAAIVAELLDAMRTMSGRPFALFGHSGAALLAFELARALRARGEPGPAQLFVSAEPAPDLPRSGPLLHTLDDAELIQRLRARGGTAPEVLANDELMELILPTLRADFGWYEKYDYRPGPPLDCPVTAFASEQDKIVGVDAVAGWAAHTTGAFQLRLVDGGHFFIQDAANTVVPMIADALAVTAR